MDREFGSNMSYSALEHIINKTKHEYHAVPQTKGYKDWLLVCKALNKVIDEVKINYTYKETV
jgi:hypothetical protein